MQTEIQRRELIEKIRELPERLRERVSGLTEAQLTTHFLAHEWTVAQNVHHLADSHMNSFIRTRLILTEERPPLKPYDQDRWAELADSGTTALDESLFWRACTGAGCGCSRASALPTGGGLGCTLRSAR